MKKLLLVVLNTFLVGCSRTETGAHGWTREDIDNNGFIQLLDIITVPDYFGQTWWM
jgi:hypothetical protein